MANRTVGPTSTYPTIAAAMLDSLPGDTIILEAGYSNETATVTHNGMTFTGGASSTGISLLLDTGIPTFFLAGTAPISVRDAPDGNDIVGNAGNNLITVMGGADAVNGGLGTDRLVVDYRAATGAVTGDSTSNVAEAGGGARIVTITDGTIEHFTILTGSGADVITTGAGDDIIHTGEGAGTVTAGQGANTITGLSGADTITALDGNNVINAGHGANTVTAGQGVNKITGGDGADTITALDGGNVILAGDGANVVTSGAGEDFITTGIGADSIVAGGGNDLITVSGGADSVSAGSGLDQLTVSYGAMTSNVVGGIAPPSVSSSVSERNLPIQVTESSTQGSVRGGSRYR